MLFAALTLGFHSFLWCGKLVNLTRDDITLAADLSVLSVRKRHSKTDWKDSHSSSGQAQTKSHAQFEALNNTCSSTPLVTFPTVHLPLRCSTIEAGHQQRNPQPTAALCSHKPRGVCHSFSMNRCFDYNSHHWSARAFNSPCGAV